jgi:hypothetical protein
MYCTIPMQQHDRLMGISEFEYEAVHTMLAVAEDANYRLEREERPEPVGEQAAVTPVEQEEKPVPESTVPGIQVLEEPMVDIEDEPLVLVPQELDELDDKAEEDDVVDDDEDDVPQVRCSIRIAGGICKPDRYAMVTKLNKEKEKDEHRKKAR